ncbi:MAG: sigma 54-interacting transcriptional regulator, partial [Treponema sp.]|nr:sigma 54-interacting transcriptional regulator [Treponema sp.]
MESIGLNELETLIEINKKLNTNSDDLDALLLYILESAMHLLSSDASSLLLVNYDGTLSFSLALGPKGKQVLSIPVSKNSIAGWVVANKKAISIDDVRKDKRFFDSVQQKTGYISKTMIACPLIVSNECIGVIELINKKDEKLFDERDLKMLQMFCDLASIAYKNAELHNKDKEKLFALQNTLSAKKGYHTLIAKSHVITDLLKIVDEIARTNISVVITGESGVGKELFAEQIHLRSNRKDKPFVRINCAALAPSLLESELFGHVKGAFTDAKQDHSGYFETANGGTLFLDEIGEMSLDLQAKLLRVLQEKTFQKVGSSKSISVDVRIIAATNKDLEQMVKDKTFRNDLYFRLNGIPLYIPPLRERKEDIEILSDYFLTKFSEEVNKKFTGFSQSAKQTLYTYYWPGNVRELENAIERACVLGKEPTIRSSDLRLNVTLPSSASNSTEDTLKDFQDADAGERSLKDAVNNFKKAYVLKV